MRVISIDWLLDIIVTTWRVTVMDNVSALKEPIHEEGV